MSSWGLTPYPCSDHFNWHPSHSRPFWSEQHAKNSESNQPSSLIPTTFSLGDRSSRKGGSEIPCFQNETSSRHHPSDSRGHLRSEFPLSMWHGLGSWLKRRQEWTLCCDLAILWTSCFTWSVPKLSMIWSDLAISTPALNWLQGVDDWIWIRWWWESP